MSRRAGSWRSRSTSVTLRIGSIEVAACALAITHDVVPPTANLHTADPECDLDYVPLTAREERVDVVLSVGSGFGGFQTAMLLARDRGARPGQKGGRDD